MGVETPNTIQDLNRNWPEGPVDSRREGDNHLRLLKGAILDTFLMDTLANRPPAGTEDRLFFSTDERIIYRDDGSNWVPFSGGAKGDTITGDTTLEASDHGSVIFVDTSGSDVAITLPAEATAGEGWWVLFIKVAAANSMIIKNDAATTLGTYEPYEAAVLATTDATDWHLLYLNIDLEFASSHASVYRSGNQGPLTEGVWTKIQLNAERYDVGNNFSGTAYTVPSTGKYLVSAHVAFTDSGGDKLALYVNGSLYARIAQNVNLGAGNAIILNANANDTFEIYAMSRIDNTKVIQGGAQYTWMNIARIV